MSSVNSINYKRLKHNIDFLSKFPELELSKIRENEQINNKYNEVQSVLIMSKDNKEMQNNIKRILDKLYQPSVLIPNTLGSFIFGCQQVDYGDVNKHCSYLCLNTWNTNNKCNFHVFVQMTSNNEDRFIFKNNSDSDKCLVYIKDDFVGFYQHELDKLIHYKVKSVCLLTTYDSKHFKVNDFQSLSSIPKINVAKVPIEIKDGSKDDPWIIFIFFIVLLIIIIFLVVYHRHR